MRLMAHAMTALCALVLVSFGVVATEAPSVPLPADSVYAIPPLTLRDQQGHVFDFASLRGRPRLVGMFYGSCQMACPLEIEYLKQIQRAVAKHDGHAIAVLLVSFDPARDDPAMLRKVAGIHHVQAPLFQLARPQQGDEGMLAGVLGVRVAGWRVQPQRAGVPARCAGAHCRSDGSHRHAGSGLHAGDRQGLGANRTIALIAVAPGRPRSVGGERPA